MERLLRDPDLGVRTEALLYLTYHTHVDPLELIEGVGDFPDFSVRSAIVAFLARPGPAQNLETAQQILAGMVCEQGAECQRTRLEAARLLGLLPDSFDPLLSTLLADADNEVAREAIRSVGKLRKRRLVPEVIRALPFEPKVVDAVTSLIGERVVLHLDQCFLKPAHNGAGTVLFSATGYGPTRGGAGQELWRSDGTAAGTVLVKDINPAVFAAASPQAFAGSSDPGEP